MGRPIMHFEIASPNLERAAAFYEELFDWDVGEEQMDGYRLVGTTDGSIGGGLLRTPEGVFPYVTIYVGVDNLVGDAGASRRARGQDDRRADADPRSRQIRDVPGSGRRDARIVRGEA